MTLDNKVRYTLKSKIVRSYLNKMKLHEKFLKSYNAIQWFKMYVNCSTDSRYVLFLLIKYIYNNYFISIASRFSIFYSFYFSSRTGELAHYFSQTQHHILLWIIRFHCIIVVKNVVALQIPKRSYIHLLNKNSFHANRNHTLSFL